MHQRSLVAAAFAATLLVGGWAAPARADGFADTVPDPNYRACITDALSLPRDAEPTTEQLAGLTSLSCTRKGIQDLRGTDALPKLEKLFVGNNAITDVAPLAGATALFSLGLEQNRIADITPLEGLTKLRSVNLAGNRLRDVSVLGTLPEWERIGGGPRHGQQVTASPAEAGVSTPVPRLVGVSGKPFAAEPPEGLTVKAGEVTYPEAGSYAWRFQDPDDLTFNGTVTVEVRAAAKATIPDDGLRACVNARLGVEDTASQPTPEQLGALRSELVCAGKQIRSLEGAQYLTGLTSLNVASNQVSDLTPVAGLKNLRSLAFPSNAVQDLTPIAGLTGLEELNASYNAFESITPIKGLTNLRDLEVGQRSRSKYEGITSLDGVQGMTKLERLVANSSRIADLTPVAGLTNLTGLHVHANRIASVGPLAGLTKLEKLGLSSNEISDIAPLRGLTQLTSLDLGHNHIADVTPLEGLKRFGWGEPRVRMQTVTAEAVPAGQAVTPPAIRSFAAVPPTLTPPEGLEMADGRVTYPAEGSYTWTWTARTGAGEFFSGKAEQPVTAASDVEIPDANLRACLADATEAPLTKASLAGLADVDCSGRSIQDLTGIELLTGAKHLDLSETALDDVAPLAALTGLETLTLDGNHVADLSPLGTLDATISARDQRLALDPVAGGVAVPAPTVVGLDGTRVSASAPEGETLVDGAVTFATAGERSWPFSAGAFTGSFVQQVISDAPVDPATKAFTDADVEACTTAGKVFVVVDPGTVAPMGGCASEFDTGLRALQSAGFTANDGGLVTTISGHRADWDKDNAWWTYTHRTRTDGGWTPWEKWPLGASSSAPKAGSVEGWSVTPRNDEDFDAFTAPRWEPGAPKCDVQLHTAGTKLVGNTTYAWGRAKDCTGDVRVEVRSGKEWKRVGTAPAGQFRVELARVASAGTHTLRAVVGDTVSDEVRLTRVARSSAAVAPVSVAGRTANAWGTVAGPATVRTQVLVGGRWSTSQVTRSEGGRYVLPLTYGRNQAGSLTWRVVVDHAHGEREVLPALTQRRVAVPLARSAGAAPAGRLANVWGIAEPGRVWTEVQLPDGRWSRSQVRDTDAAGRYVIELTYGKHQPGTYRWRVASQTDAGVVRGPVFTFVRR